MFTRFQNLYIVIFQQIGRSFVTMPHSDQTFKHIVPFVIGGISGAAATLVIQPLDTLKVLAQVISEKMGKTKTQAVNLFNIIKKIKLQYGLSSLYRGLDSAIFRQLFYASARVGAYDGLISALQNQKNRRALALQRVGISLISGAFGAVVGNPFQVALIRKQASLSTGKISYKNTYQAFKSIIKDQSILSLWSGLSIAIVRVGLINFGQLASTDILSEQMQIFGLPKYTHQNLVAVTASFVTSIISLPADNIKVKLQKQLKNQKIYSGIWDCLMKSVQREGVVRLWVGFPIYLMRGAPHSFILIRTKYFLTEEWKKRSVVQ